MKALVFKYKDTDEVHSVITEDMADAARKFLQRVEADREQQRLMAAGCSKNERGKPIIRWCVSYGETALWLLSDGKLGRLMDSAYSVAMFNDIEEAKAAIRAQPGYYVPTFYKIHESTISV